MAKIVKTEVPGPAGGITTCRIDLEMSPKKIGTEAGKRSLFLAGVEIAGDKTYPEIADAIGHHVVDAFERMEGLPLEDGTFYPGVMLQGVDIGDKLKEVKELIEEATRAYPGLTESEIIETSLHRNGQ